MAKEYKHYDIFGKEIICGSHVAYSDGFDLRIGTVDKLSEKKIRVWPINKLRNKYSTGKLVYGSNIVVVEGPKVTMYILQNMPVQASIVD
jgi:hypothetical protein